MMLADPGEPAETLRAARGLGRTEAIRAQEVFELVLNERREQTPPIEVWAMLLSSGKGFFLIGDMLEWMVSHGYAAEATGIPASSVGTLAGDAIANVLRMAEEIRTGNSLRVTGARDASAELRSASLASLTEPRVTQSSDALHAAIGLVSCADWLGQLNALVKDLEGPVAATRAAAGTPWWR
jgi:hypothetical protein